jgi:hypothetical protein
MRLSQIYNLYIVIGEALKKSTIRWRWVNDHPRALLGDVLNRVVVAKKIGGKVTACPFRDGYSNWRNSPMVFSLSTVKRPEQIGAKPGVQESPRRSIFGVSCGEERERSCRLDRHSILCPPVAEFGVYRMSKILVFGDTNCRIGVGWHDLNPSSRKHCVTHFVKFEREKCKSL